MSSALVLSGQTSAGHTTCQRYTLHVCRDFCLRCRCGQLKDPAAWSQRNCHQTAAVLWANEAAQTAVTLRRVGSQNQGSAGRVRLWLSIGLRCPSNFHYLGPIIAPNLSRPLAVQRVFGGLLPH